MACVRGKKRRCCWRSFSSRHESKFLKSRARPDERGYVELGVEYKYTEHWFKPEQLTAMLPKGGFAFPLVLWFSVGVHHKPRWCLVVPLKTQMFRHFPSKWTPNVQPSPLIENTNPPFYDYLFFSIVKFDTVLDLK